MTNSINLTEKQKELKSKLESLHRQVWDYIESDGENLSKDAVKNLYEAMAQTAHDLHMSLKQSGHEPRHHKYMLENRGCSPDDVKFYEHVHPVQDLLAFIEDEHANDDPEDQTLGKTFIMKVYTRRWGHYDHYELTRTEIGWNVKMLGGEEYACKKDARRGLNKLLSHDGVCYPEKINSFFEWLWERAAEDGLSEKEVQKAIKQLGDWISECEMSAPRDGIFEGLI